MAGFSSPGVYRREIDLSEILVSTGISNGGIVIRSQQGPVRRPVLVSNGKEFVETFGTPYYVSGGPTTNGIGGKLVPELGYGAYGALEFLKESNTLFVVRAYTNTGSDIKDRYAAVGVGVAAGSISGVFLSPVWRSFTPEISNPPIPAGRCLRAGLCGV